jgi:hypothetical protein
LGFATTTVDSSHKQLSYLQYRVSGDCLRIQPSFYRSRDFSFLFTAASFSNQIKLKTGYLSSAARFRSDSLNNNSTFSLTITSEQASRTSTMATSAIASSLAVQPASTPAASAIRQRVQAKSTIHESTSDDSSDDGHSDTTEIFTPPSFTIKELLGELPLILSFISQYSRLVRPCPRSPLQNFQSRDVACVAAALSKGREYYRACASVEAG